MRVLIFGTFDYLHPGHHFVIGEAMKRGDVSIVVARDRNVATIKGRPAGQKEDERVRALREAYPGVEILLGDPKDFSAPLRAIKPDLILLGYDQRLPPGITEKDFPCPVKRLPAFRQEEFKSSLRRNG